MLRRSLLPVSIALLLQAGLLSLAAFGPPLWASQISQNRVYALPIFVVGELLMFAIFWPIFARSILACVLIFVVVPICALVAGSLQHASHATSLKALEMVDGIFLIIATMWAIAPQMRGGRAFLWSAMLALSIGSTAIEYLSSDFEANPRSLFHFSPLHQIANDFAR